MTMKKSILTALLIFCFSLGDSAATASNWSSCESELDDLSSEASDASDYARKVKNLLEELESKKAELEDKKSELEDCLSFPDIYDYYGDGCQSLNWDYKSAIDEYESAKGDYESAINRLQSELDNIKNVTASVESYCKDSQSFIANKVSTCNYLTSQKNKYEISSLLQICKSLMSENECKLCFGLK